MIGRKVPANYHYKILDKRFLNMATSVCILTTVHSPFDVRIFHKQAKSLFRAGYDVTLVAQHDKDEVVDGVKILALKKPRNRLERIIKTTSEAYRKALLVDSDIYHFHDPELLPIGVKLKKRGKKVIYDVHEDVPRQTLSKHYLPVMIRQPLAWTIGAVEWIGAKVFDAIASATPKIAKRFPAHKTVSIQNFPLLNELAGCLQIPYLKRPESFVYIGDITLIRGAREMVCAVGHLKTIANARLSLAGDFVPPMLHNELKSLGGWPLVDYHGHVSREQVASLLNSARAGLVTLHPIVNYIDSYPVKMFEYMSVGLPVIASDFPLWRQIIDGAGCGLLVDPLDPAAIAEAMRWILEHPAEAEEMGKRGRSAVERVYNWDSEAAKLKDMYKKLLAQ
jgi:glycosyltransferase involved in cell wall biosynthesis